MEKQYWGLEERKRERSYSLIPQTQINSPIWGCHQVWNCHQNRLWEQEQVLEVKREQIEELNGAQINCDLICNPRKMTGHWDDLTQLGEWSGKTGPPLFSLNHFILPLHPIIIGQVSGVTTAFKCGSECPKLSLHACTEHDSLENAMIDSLETIATFWRLVCGIRYCEQSNITAIKH